MRRENLDAGTCPDWPLCHAASRGGRDSRRADEGRLRGGQDALQGGDGACAGGGRDAGQSDGVPPWRRLVHDVHPLRRQGLRDAPREVCRSSGMDASGMHLSARGERRVGRGAGRWLADARRHALGRPQHAQHLRGKALDDVPGRREGRLRDGSAFDRPRLDGSSTSTMLPTRCHTARRSAWRSRTT